MIPTQVGHKTRIKLLFSTDLVGEYVAELGEDMIPSLYVYRLVWFIG